MYFMWSTNFPSSYEEKIGEGPDLKVSIFMRPSTLSLSVVSGILYFLDASATVNLFSFTESKASCRRLGLYCRYLQLDLCGIP